MARNVYFDPFGSYTAGIQAGVQDGMGLEQGARQAQLHDYNFQNFLPLQLQAARREEDFNKFFDPYRRQVAGYGAERARMATGRDAFDFAGLPARLFGQVNPALTAMDQYWGVRGMPTGDGGMDFLDTQNPGQPSFVPDYRQNFLDFYMRPEAIQNMELLRQLQETEIARLHAEAQRAYSLRAMGGQPTTAGGSVDGY